MEVHADVDKLYSCRLWSPHFPADLVIDNHWEIVSNKSANARNTLMHEVHPYISDSPSAANHYQYYPTATPSHKLLIFIHGGYWQFGDLAGSSFLADLFVHNNCNFAAIGYDLCPSVSLQQIVHEVHTALRSIITRHAGITEVFLCGHSAGAHLALMSVVYDGFRDELALSVSDKNKLKGLILISGIFDIRPICRTSINEKVNLPNVEEAWRLSPMRCVEDLVAQRSLCDGCGRVLILVAEFDSPAYIEQSLRLSEVMSKLGEVKYALAKNKDHFDLIHDIGNEDYSVTDLVLSFLGL